MLIVFKVCLNSFLYIKALAKLFNNSLKKSKEVKVISMLTLVILSNIRFKIIKTLFNRV
jgi:hypothetical protein